MVKENSSSYAILGILDLGAQSGYDIKKWIEDGIGYFWHIGYGQIYPILNSFIKEELATVKIEKTEGRPDRKVYRLTEKGSEALYRWLEKSIDYSRFNKNELLLKLFFCDKVSVKAGMKHITEYKRYISSGLKNLCELEGLFYEKGNDGLICRISTVRYGIAAYEGLLKWCDETLLRLEGQRTAEKRQRGGAE